MKKILPILISFTLLLCGCSSSSDTDSVDQNSPEGIYTAAFNNTFNSNYYYESYSDNNSLQTITYAQYFLDDDFAYVGYIWYEYNGNVCGAAIHYCSDDNLTVVTTDNENKLSNVATNAGSVDKKSNLFKNENIEITDTSMDDDILTIDFTAGTSDVYYVETKVTIEDNKITQEETTIYEDEDHETSLSANITRYYEDTNDKDTELEKAKGYQNAPISDLVELEPEF